MNPIEVAPVSASGLGEPVRLLEEWLRDGEPVPDDFVGRLQRSVKAGDTDVLAARVHGRPHGQLVGVLVLAYRPSASLGGLFASIEDLYVRPEFRRSGAGRALLRVAGERCSERGISYLEAQVEDEAAASFYRALGYEPEPGVRVFSRSLVIEDQPAPVPKPET